MIKSRFFAAAVLCLAIAILLCSIPCAANEASSDTVGARQIFDGVLASKGAGDGGEGLQKWVDGQIKASAGRGAEWYVLALAQYAECDLSAYETELLSYLENNKVSSASSRLKYALCLAAVGSTHPYITSTLNDSIGKQGLMSWIFGLHLMNNGYVCDEYTLEDVKKKIIELQLEDGGWAIMGHVADVDATAMAIQALSPYCQKDDEVKNAVDPAIALLSTRQLDSGDYSSYGVPNPESTAQVLVALSSLGIDPLNGEAFIKNGNTLLDGIMRYRLDDGSFAHKEGGASNESATAQVFYATVAYMRMSEGKTPLYILDKAETRADLRETVTEDCGEPAHSSTDEMKPFVGYKLWVSIIVIGIGCATCLALFLLKKRHLKNFIAVWLAVAVAVAVVCLTNIKSTEEYYLVGDAPKENAIGKVLLSIRCDTVAGRAEHIPDDGIILDAVEVEIAEGDTVYSVLLDAAKKYQLHVENDGSDSSVYISGINYLYELDYGDLSGWTYWVNGEQGSVGASEQVLSDGDTVEWRYTCELGEDLK